MSEINRSNLTGPHIPQASLVSGTSGQRFEQLVAQNTPGNSLGSGQQTLQQLQTRLNELLTLLNTDQQTLQNSTLETEAGPVSVSSLLDGLDGEAEQIRQLINVANIKLEQQHAALQQPAEVDRGPPLVEPVAVYRMKQFKAGDLYEFKVDEPFTQDNVLRLIVQSLNQYIGGTYHMQLLDAEGNPIPLAAEVKPNNATALQSVGNFIAAQQTMNQSFGLAANEFSVYWHGFEQENGTSYTVSGYNPNTERTEIKLGGIKQPIDWPVFIVEIDGVREQRRLDQIPFAAVRISGGDNQLHTLPTQADVAEAHAALDNPDTLTLQQLFKYSTKSLQRADESLTAKIDIAASDANIKKIIARGFAGTQTVDEVEDVSRQLMSVVLTNRFAVDTMHGSFSLIKAVIISEQSQSIKATVLESTRQALAGKLPEHIISGLRLDEYGYVDLKNINLSGQDLSGVTLHSVNLKAANLENANLQGAHIVESHLVEVNMSGAYLQNSTLNTVDLSSSNLSAADLRGAVLDGVTLNETNFNQANLSGLSLHHKFISNVNMSAADLSGADLTGARLQGVNLRGAKLNSANLSGAYFSNVNLESTDLSDTRLQNFGADSFIRINEATLQTNPAFVQLLEQKGIVVKDELHLSRIKQALSLKLPDRDFSDIGLTSSGSGFGFALSPNQMLVDLQFIDLSGADLSGLDLRGVSLVSANLSGANLQGVTLDRAFLHSINLQNADLRNLKVINNVVVLQANLSGADLRETDIRKVYLAGSALQWANLSGVDLSNKFLASANMSGANLSNANLHRASFEKTNLQGAVLSNANLSEADLSGANLSGANLIGANLEGAQHNEVTQWQGAQLSPEQIQTLGLEAEQLTPNNTISPGETNLGISQNNSSAPADPDTPNSLQGNSSAPPDISDYGVSHTLKPFNNNPNGIIGNDGTQAGHGNNGNNNGAITAVAGDAPDPDQPFQVINGQVNVSGIQLPELDLSGNVVQPGESIFGTPVGLPELPTYTPAPRTEEGAADIPVADSGSETTPPIAQQPGGVTWGGDLGNDKGRTAAELGLDPSGKLPGPEKAKMPEPTPGYGEGVNPQDLNQTNTRDWGGGPVTPDQAKLTPEGFPQQDKTLEGILNPEGPAGARFRFPPSTEEIPAAEYQAVVKALPALQQISVGEYSQLSSADQKNILVRAAEYQTLPADIKANTTLLQYADSGQTSASQRGQMLGVQQKQTVQTSQQILSDAQSGLSDSTIQVINTRINALQQNTAAINQQTQALTQSNTNRQSALVAPTTSDPVTAAFIKPDIKPGQTPPASNSAATTSQLNTQADPIPRFMVVRTANGPQLMENLPNGKTQMLPYPIPADTPVTRQASNGSWTHVPDAYAIGAKNLLDTLFLQGAVKMLNNGNAVQVPGAENAPTAPTNTPQPAL